MELKQCTKCDRVLPATSEHWYLSKEKCIQPCKECLKKYRDKNKGIQSERYKKWHKKNKERLNNKSRKWCRENKEHVSKTSKRWRSKNKNSIKKYNETYSNKKHKITNNEWKSCKEYFDYSCAYCGISEDLAKELYNQRLHKEHVLHEGKNDISNCVPSCKGCNSSKARHTLNEWYNKNNIKYTYERYHKIYLWLRYDYKDFRDKKKKQF